MAPVCRTGCLATKLVGLLGLVWTRVDLPRREDSLCAVQAWDHMKSRAAVPVDAFIHLQSGPASAHVQCVHKVNLYKLEANFHVTPKKAGS
jgi:hypothetical protein